MTTSRTPGSRTPGGLRRFARPPHQPGSARPPAPPPPADQSPPADQPPPAAAWPGPTTAQAAATALPPLLAELLEAAPGQPGELSPADLDRPALPFPVPGSGVSGSQAADETCELCRTEIPADHAHVADLENSSLVCACRACYLLFTRATAVRGRYRAVPDRYLSDDSRVLTPARWDELEIPVGLAFFLKNSRAERVVGFYPSPAGATECVLDLGAWDRLTADHPLLGAVAPDVEAALITRTDAGVEYFLVPIDACYELVGRMRMQWRGFDGGAEAKASIAAFLDEVRSRARPYSAATAGPESRP